MEYELEIIADVSAEDVCGENLEDDSGFQNFFFESQGTPERFDGQNTTPAEPPDWRAVKKQGLVFLKTTRDLKLISVISQAVLNTEGLVKFEQCLSGIAQLVETKWTEVYPSLDEDDGDPLERISALGHLSESSYIVDVIKKIPIANSKVLGNVTLQIIDRAVNPSSEKSDSDLEIAQVIGVFKDSDKAEITALYAAINRSIEHLNKISQIFIDQAGNEYSVNFDTVTEVLSHLASTLEKYGDLEVEVVEPDNESDDVSSSEGQKSNEVTNMASFSSNTNMKLTSRADVIRCFELISKYYAEYEPSSPVPVLVNRSKKLVNFDFINIVKDIFPDALEQIQKLGGLSEDGTSSEEGGSDSSGSSW